MQKPLNDSVIYKDIQTLSTISKSEIIIMARYNQKASKAAITGATFASFK